MRYQALIPLVAGLANLVLGVIVYRSRGHTKLGRVFTFLAGTLVLWNFHFVVLYSVSDKELAFSLARWLRLGSVFVQPAILHLVLSLAERRHTLWRRILAVDYLVACALSVANGCDLLVSGLRPFAWGYYSVGGPFYNVFTGSMIFNFCGAAAVLVYDYRTSRAPRMRSQLKLWLLGMVAALPLGLTNVLPAYGIPFYPLGNLGSAAWAGVVAYAIVRHRLMDIDIAITKGIAYATVAVVLLVPTFAIALWLQRLSFGQIHPDFSFALLLMLIAVGLLFPTLRLQAESRIERSLFREKHEYRLALSAFTRSIVRILDPDRLLNELASTLTKTLNLERVVIALADDTKRLFLVRAALGPGDCAEIPRDNELIQCLTRRQQAVLRTELEASTDHAERTTVAELCRQNGWEVCIPLTAGGAVIGFISLGRKRDLDPFSAGDLQLLETLGAEASVALENARLYDELRRSKDIIRRADRLSALGTLAAGIAHEIRNPMVSIQTFFQLVPDRLHDEEFLTTFLGMAASEVKRISALINELLSFARSPTRTLGPVQLNDIAESVTTLLEPEARKHNLTLKRVLASNLATITGDADQIKQVMINLVLNAIQATPSGGLVSITTRAAPHRDRLYGRVEISDTGAGMPSDQLDHIFDPFFTTKDKGTGLGLAIAHQIVSEHGGAITVESTEGRGTSFSIDFPAAERTTSVGVSEGYARSGAAS